jgi:hypothetical protein
MIKWADESKARHWIERYASGIDEEPQLDRILDCVAIPLQRQAAPITDEQVAIITDRLVEWGCNISEQEVRRALEAAQAAGEPDDRDATIRRLKTEIASWQHSLRKEREARLYEHNRKEFFKQEAMRLRRVLQGEVEQLKQQLGTRQ